MPIPHQHASAPAGSGPPGLLPLASARQRGRIVMLGEAAMLSVQIARWEQNGKVLEFSMGMNMPGTDDKQFALNVVHWLTRLLN